MATWRVQALSTGKGTIDAQCSQALLGWDAGQVLPDTQILKEELKVRVL